MWRTTLRSVCGILETRSWVQPHYFRRIVLLQFAPLLVGASCGYMQAWTRNRFACVVWSFHYQANCALGVEPALIGGERLYGYAITTSRRFKNCFQNRNLHLNKTNLSKLSLKNPRWNAVRRQGSHRGIISLLGRWHSLLEQKGTMEFKALKWA